MKTLTQKLWFNLWISILCFLTIVILGTFIISSIEKYSYSESLYFIMMTATTIGFGDITPSTSSGKLFISLYSVLAVGAFFYLLAIIAMITADRIGVNKK